MKKILAILCALSMIFALCACGGSAPAPAPAPEAAPEAASEPAAEEAAPEAAADKVFNVGVCQLVQHPALDKATEGFVDALTEKLGDKVKINVQNASGDSATCATIVGTFVSDEADLIMANATPALQAAQAATNKIPILGTSITEYGVALGLDNFAGKTGINVSGTSDLAPLDGQADVLHELFPDAATVGILYCSAEANSKYQVEAITPFLEAHGLKVNAYTFADSNDVAAVTATACDEPCPPACPSSAARRTSAPAAAWRPSPSPTTTSASPPVLWLLRSSQTAPTCPKWRSSTLRSSPRNSTPPTARR